MGKKRGPERLTSDKRISGALENTPANQAILDDKPMITSLGHWKAKIIESGLFGEMKDGDDAKTFYATLSKKADEFLKHLVEGGGGQINRLPATSRPQNDDGSLNLDFEFDSKR